MTDYFRFIFYGSCNFSACTVRMALNNKCMKSYRELILKRGSVKLQRNLLKHPLLKE